MGSNFSTGRDYLDTKMEWVGKLPKTKEEAKEFMLKNNILVKVSGSKRNLTLNLNWNLTKIDFNFATAGQGHISMIATGNNPWLGDFSFSRDFNWEVENKVIHVDWTGLDQFPKDSLSTTSPVETSFK